MTFLEEVNFFGEDPKLRTASGEDGTIDGDTNETGTSDSDTKKYEHQVDVKHQVGGLLLRHICQLICNGHAIREKLVVTETGQVDLVEEQRIATAIYPATSLLNHSCQPNVIARWACENLKYNFWYCLKSPFLWFYHFGN